MDVSAIDRLRERLGQFKNLSFHASEDTLAIDPVSEDGFPITFVVDTYEYTVCFGGWHGHFENEEDAFEYIVAGLGGQLRVREVRRSGKPCRWIVERMKEGRWRKEDVLCESFLRFWKKREERIYVNKTIE